MDYISTVQAANKWGISSRRVVILAKDGRIPGALQIGSRWMIPAAADKPADGRAKTTRLLKGGDSGLFFRYPCFEGHDEGSINPPLTSEELILKKAREAFHACRFEESLEIISHLLDHTNDRYYNIHALYTTCMIYIMLDRTSEFLECYGRLNSELQADFPRKKEMESLIHEIDAGIGMNSYFINQFKIDHSYPYHESYMSHLAMLCMVALYSSDFSILSEQELIPYEYIAASLEKSSCYVDRQSIHFYLGLAYSGMLNESKMNYHYRKALELSMKYCLYYQTAIIYFYYGKTLDAVLNEFPADFVERIHTLTEDVHKRYCDFIESTVISSFYGLMSNQDFIYVFCAVHGLTNRQTAALLKISSKAVAKRYGEIYASLNVTNKKKMIELYHNSTTLPNLSL